MLGVIRRIIRGPGAYALLAVIILPLSFFGFNWLQVDSEADRKEIGIINNEEINAADLQHRAAIELETLEAQGVTRDQIDPERFQRYVFQRVALDKLLEQEARRRQINVSLDEVDQSIVAASNFVAEDGRFSSGLFRQQLANLGYTPAEYREVVRASLIREKLLSSYKKFGFLTEDQRARVADLHRQRRFAVYTVIDAKLLRDEIELNEDELRARYEKDKSTYTSQEQLIVDYIVIERKDYYQEVPEEIVRGYYEDELNQIRERRHISHILLETDSQRDDNAAQSELAILRERVVSGEDFAELAREHSEDLGSAENGGDLGWFTLEIFPDDVAVHLIDMKPGELSQPAKSDSGWHLFYAHDDFEFPSYEERRDELYEVAQYLDSDARYREAVKNASIELFASKNLEPIARLVDKEIFTSKKFGKNGSEEWPFNNLTLVKEAFSDSILQGENSRLLSIGPDAYIALNLKEYFPVQAQSFDEARNKVEDSLRVERSRAKGRQRASALLESMRKSSRSPSDYFEDEGYEINVVEGARRAGDKPSRKILDRIFSMPKPDANGKATLAALEINEERTAIIAVEKVDVESEEESSAARSASDDIGNVYASLLNMKLRIGAQLKYFPDENDEKGDKAGDK